MGGRADEFAHKTNCRDKDNRETLSTFLARFGPTASEKWEKHTWPLMLDAVRAVLLSCRDAVLCSEWDALKTKPSAENSGPRAFELIGFDFALDANWDPWLLEGNIFIDMLE